MVILNAPVFLVTNSVIFVLRYDTPSPGKYAHAQSTSLANATSNAHSWNQPSLRLVQTKNKHAQVVLARAGEILSKRAGFS